ALLAGGDSRGQVAINGGSAFGGTQSALGAGGRWQFGDTWTLGALVSSHTVSFTEVDAYGDATGTSVARSQQAGGVAVGARFGRVRAGVVLKGVSDSLAGNTATTGAADLGVAGAWGDLTAAVAA